MSIEMQSARSRRALLAAALGGLGAVVANAMASPSVTRAVTGDPVLAGKSNTADAETSLEGSSVNYDAAVLKVSGVTGSTIAAINNASVPIGVGGSALSGTSAAGHGVVGQGARSGVTGIGVGAGPGVWGTSGYAGPGVFGETIAVSSAPAIFGQASGGSTPGPGVYGVSRSGSTEHPEPPANVGVAGWSPAGIGVQGSSDSGTGIEAFVGAGAPPAPPTTPTAVYGNAAGADPTGMWGQGGAASSGFSTGVYGEGDTGVWGFGGWGVFGASDASGTGIYGLSAASVPGAPAHTGVFGYSDSGFGVYAKAVTGTALYVDGKARFSRSKKVTIGAGRSSLKVTLAGVTTSSLVFAVLHSNRSGVYVRAVVPASGSFTIYLNKAVTSTTYVAYFVVN